MSEGPRQDGRRAPLVRWSRVGRRLKVLAGACVLIAAAVTVVAAALGHPWRVVVGAGAGIAVGVLLAGAVLLAGLSAWQGMLRAGERGERLSSRDVGLRPPRRERD